MKESGLITSKLSALKKNQHEVVCNICLDLASFYEASGHSDKAIQEYDDYVAAFEKGKLDNLLQLATVYRGRGDLKLEAGIYSGSLSDFEKFLSLSRSLGDVVEIQRALTSLGRAYLFVSEQYSDPKRLKMLEKADKYSREAFEVIPGNQSKACSHSEKCSMKLVVHINRYTILHQLGKSHESEQQFQLGEQLGQAEHMYDKLFSLYDSRISVLLRSGDLKQALHFQLKAMDCVMSGAQLDKDRVFEAYCNLAALHLHFDDIDAAKAVLKAAYAVKGLRTNQEQKSDLQMLLKLCLRLRQWLEVTTRDSSASDGPVMEKLADLCSEIPILRVRAIEFYTSALKVANESLCKTRLLCSLGQTHCDLGDLVEARRCFETSISISSASPVDAISSMTGLAKCLEEEDRKQHASRILDLYRQAKQLSLDSGKLNEAIDILTAMRSFHEDEEDSQAVSLVSDELEKIRGMTDSLATADGDEQTADESSDVDLERVLGDHDLEHQRRNRKGRCKMSQRINKLGETKLHQVCKKDGNLAELKMLIRMGIDVDAKDFTGYTALHDACIGIQFDYVQALVKSGADVNVANVQGITPLMDACYAGSGQLIQYLLDHGADPNKLDKNRWTAKDHLEHRLSSLEPGLELEEARSALSRLVDSTLSFDHLIKQPVCVLEQDVADNDQDFIEDDLKHGTRRAIRSRRSTFLERRIAPSPAKSRVTREYKNIMDCLSRKTLPKRKSVSPDFALRGTQRKSFKKSRSDAADSPLVESDEADQASLTSPSSPEDQPIDLLPSRSSSPPLRATPGPASTVTPSAMMGASSCGAVIKVRLCDRLLFMPFSGQDTVSQMCDQIADKFNAMYLKRPRVILKTSKQGAPLHPDDNLAHFFSSQASLQPELVAEAESWQFGSLDECYQAFCTEHKVHMYTNVSLEMRKAVGNGRLALAHMKGEDLKWALDSVHYHNCITHLTLKGCSIGFDDALQKALQKALPLLPNLLALNLSLNALTSQHFDIIFQSVLSTPSGDQPAAQRPLAKLTELSLAFNFFSNDLRPRIETVMGLTGRICKLDLTCCHLTHVFFRAEGSLNGLTSLIASYNPLGLDGVRDLLGSEGARHLKVLGLESCLSAEGEASRLLGLSLARFCGQDLCALTELRLARNGLTDQVLPGLTSGLLSLSQPIQCLDLSFNQLSMAAVAILLNSLRMENRLLLKLRLHGNQPVTESVVSVLIKLIEQPDQERLQLLTLACETRADRCPVADRLSTAWQDTWRQRARVSMDDKRLSLAIQEDV